MATLVLTAGVGSLGLSGWSLFGTQLAATALGTVIDSALFTRNRNQITEGPRLKEIQLTNSTEGSHIQRMYGRTRIGGTLVWATNFKETRRTETTRGARRYGLFGPRQKFTQVFYEYQISFAVAFCEGGPCTQLGRVWFDNKEVDISKFKWRWYEGTQDQQPDSFIQQIEGTDKVPAYRGIAYLVFEDLPLADFGNRIPQVTAEITRVIPNDDPDHMENLIEGVCMIPSAGEFTYSTVPTLKDDGEGNSVTENAHFRRDRANILTSMDQMGCSLPNTKTVNLVVSWFGSDLRVGECELRPKVEAADKDTRPVSWSVDGISRANAQVVSLDSLNRPNYGGTPSDQSVIQAIQELKARGYKVCFYPFILMDIPPGNSLPDPYSDNAATIGQPVFPWRGRLTCSPAAGFAGTVDKTSTAATQVNNFFNRTWGVRRMILHYANLCVAAGGVDYFCVGTEMRELTFVRSSASNYPAVNNFVTLINDVKAIVGAECEVTYVADWSEYHSHRPSDGSGDVYFHLDPVWQVADFIGIDNYLPMSDWRDGTQHLDYDAVNGPRKIYDRDYLSSNIEGGELFDWFYASDADRQNQVRTPITDGAHDKPWVFRQKDIRSWWENPHFNRPGGIESGSPTSWTPESKRIIFTEFGAPAVDKSTNQPNVFFDPKSSESFLPYFSNGERDDMIQRIYIEEFLKHWRDNGGNMVKVEDCWVWTWDARPYPQFPFLETVWSDGDNWRLGHWLNGRAGIPTLGAVIKDFMSRVGLENRVDVSQLTGRNALVQGYVIDGVMSPREMLLPLFPSLLFDGFESEGLIKFTLREDLTFEDVDLEELVSLSDNPSGYSLVRQQETELLDAARIDFLDLENAYQLGSASGTKSVGASSNTTQMQFPLVMDQRYARSLADIVVQETWAQRETGEFALPNAYMRYDPGDGLTFGLSGRDFAVRITSIENGSFRKIDFSTFEPSIYGGLSFSGRSAPQDVRAAFGRSVVEFLDIPLFSSEDVSPWAPRMAVYQNPFPPSVDVYIEDTTTSDLLLINELQQRTNMGRTITQLDPDIPWVFHEGMELRVQVTNPSFQPTSEAFNLVLAGNNTIIVKNDDGFWEIIQFQEANLVGGDFYDLKGLIRGQNGTEADMSVISPGARVVFLDGPLEPLGITINQRALEFTYRFGPSVDDPSEDSFDTRTLEFRSAGLMPYAPSGLTCDRVNVDGTLEFNWIRRTRFGGDDWGPEEVPLNEEFERYDLEICENDGSVVKTVAGLTSTTYTYTDADQISDFGSVRTSVRIRVYQISALVGRGFAADKIVSF